MNIKEIELRSGLPRSGVRFYESEGLLRPARSPNGYRDYSEDDLATLLKIKRKQSELYTILHDLLLYLPIKIN